MTINAGNVYFYAATQGDYLKCLAAANVCGIPSQNVLGTFSDAWNQVQSGESLVLAVGGAALYALYYNPCNWQNPSGMPVGHTPFEVFPSVQGIANIKSGYFVNAAGYTALDSLKLSVMLGYYAIHGTFPVNFLGMPQQEIPQKVCVASSMPVITLSGVTNPTTHLGPSQLNNSVGVYATFSTVTDVASAIALGWPGIGHTAALGTKSDPYTQVLVGRPDIVVSTGLANSQKTDVWWLSFWTVSWPAAGDSFSNAGFKAGQYAANIVKSYKGRVPNYMVLDPEGYNTSPTAAINWAEFIYGWAQGIKGVDRTLNSGFYCNQSQYMDYNLASVTLPAFIAISPIDGNQPMVHGENIVGYIAYYADVPAASDISQVLSWNGKLSTVQFRDSGVDAGPM